MNEKKQHWTKAEADYVISNAGIVAISEMAEKVNRSEQAVHLFLLRHRVAIGSCVKRNIVLEMLKLKFGHPEYFKPTREFYQRVGIGQRRWWMLYNGTRQVTGKEYVALARELKVTVEEAMNTRQLSLFNQEL